MGLSESDTRAKLIDPKLKKSGWDEDKIIREHLVTDGKIIDVKGNRDPGKFADYLLLHGGMIVAVANCSHKVKIMCR